MRMDSRLGVTSESLDPAATESNIDSRVEEDALTRDTIPQLVARAI